LIGNFRFVRIIGDFGLNLKNKILETELRCRLFWVYSVNICEFAMLEPNSVKPLCNCQLLFGSTKIVLELTRKETNLCPLVDVTLPWEHRSPRLYFLSSCDCSWLVKLKFIEEDNSWFTIFASSPYILAFPIAPRNLRHARYLFLIGNDSLPIILTGLHYLIS